MEDHHRGVHHSEGTKTSSSSSDRGFSEVLHTAASAMASGGGASSSPPSADHSAAGHRKKPSPAEVLSSAKVIFDTAKAKMHHGDGQSSEEQQKLDKAKLAAAAGDVLSAARHYGKLDEKNYGKYVQKAEDYLHGYHAKHSTGGVPVNNSTHQENKVGMHSKGSI